MMARQLPAGCAVLEDSCPPHLSDAAQMMNDAWNSITANTIAACWKHTPCLDVNEERDSVDFVARIEQDFVVQMNKLKTGNFAHPLIHISDDTQQTYQG